MNKMDLYRAFGAVDDDILERSESTNTKTIRFRWQHALIAAIMCICLMGAGVVAVIWGDSIQNWFGHYWQAITGQEMSSGQAALIDHLSQEIGNSQTIDDVMVTVPLLMMVSICCSALKECLLPGAKTMVSMKQRSKSHPIQRKKTVAWLPMAMTHMGLTVTAP